MDMTNPRLKKELGDCSTSTLNQEPSEEILDLRKTNNNDSYDGKLCSWCGKRNVSSCGGSVGAGAWTYCSERCYEQYRRDAFKKRSLCLWCSNVNAQGQFNGSINIHSNLDVNETKFCSEYCLAQFKLKLFCDETVSHLHQIKDNSGNEKDKDLITPSLWLKDALSLSPTPNLTSPNYEALLQGGNSEFSSTTRNGYEETETRSFDTKHGMGTKRHSSSSKQINSVSPSSLQPSGQQQETNSRNSHSPPPTKKQAMRCPSGRGAATLSNPVPTPSSRRQRNRINRSHSSLTPNRNRSSLQFHRSPKSNPGLGLGTSTNGNCKLKAQFPNSPHKTLESPSFSIPQTYTTTSNEDSENSGIDEEKFRYTRPTPNCGKPRSRYCGGGSRSMSNDENKHKVAVFIIPYPFPFLFPIPVPDSWTQGNKSSCSGGKGQINPLDSDLD